MTQATELRELATLLDVSSSKVGIGLPSGTPSNALVISDGVRTSAAITAGTTALEIARTGGGDVGILINKDTSKWLIGVDNSDGNAGPLRFMYGAYNAAAHPGFGTAADGLNLAYDGAVGIGVKTPAAPLHIQFSNNNGGVGGHLIKNTNTGTTSNFASLSTQAVNGTIQGTFGSAHYSAWGNAVVFAGSQTAHPFKILTGNTVRGTFDTSGRLGINQNPLANNFALQVTGLGGASGDARAVYLKGSGAHTNIGGTGPTLVLQNTNSTANNIVKLSFESASAGETVSINAINTNHSSHYGDMAFNTRGSSGYSEKMRIMANGNVGIGTDGPTQKLEVAGTALVENAKLKAIAKSNTDTAVDVFIYDTRKDSDGGAWRKRTQNTSWYNEALNTSTRGARKEFPCVAVIVVASNDVIIYDGDDPDMPLWMKFSLPGHSVASNWSSTSIGLGTPGFQGANASSAMMLNGQLIIGCASGSGLGGYLVNFISELMIDMVQYGTATDQFYHKAGNISQRDVATTYTVPQRYNNNQKDPKIKGRLIHGSVNDIDMTVLSNARIDSETGLPIPTIAVATDGGVSIIRDVGNVVNITGTSSVYNYWDKVKFTKDDKLIIQANYQNIANQLTHVVDFPSTDVSQNQVNSAYTILNGRYYHGDSCVPRISVSSFKPKVVPMEKDVFAFGHRTDLYGGINLIAEEPQTVSGITSDAAVCFIEHDFNTGWMPGDIRVAALSDTSTTNISASGNTNILTGSWTNNASFPYETFTSSGLDITSAINTSAYGAANKTWTATAGKTYTAYFNLTLNSGTAPTLYVQTSSSMGNGISYQTVNGANSFTFRATMNTSSYFSFSIPSSGVATNFSVSNLELYEGGDANRVHNPLILNNFPSLSVFGTVPKTAVATGAELVGYSFPSNSDYLQQSYTSGLDFGTSDFSVMCWVKPDSSMSSYPSIVDRYVSSNTESTAWLLKIAEPTSSFYFFSGNSTILTATGKARFGVWQQVVAVRRNGVLYFYIDGRLEETGTMTHSVTSVGAKLKVSKDATHYLGNSNLALLRVSATAPTPEQISNMYEDERRLFQDNAKATLYGTSNTITALAYDDDTQLLHAGTSAGRSVFQGLNRVDNTTDAIGSAINASNSFIVEE